MPYVYDPLLEEEKNPQQQGQQPPMTGGGSTFAGGGGAQPNQNPQEKGANRQGSGFVGLDQYMAANKGSQFGNQVTGKVGDTVNTAKQQLGQGAQDFTNASNQGTTRWNDVGNEFKGIVDTAGKDTTADQTARAKALEKSQYTGPESFYGTAAGNQAIGGIDKAKQQAQALQSEGGRFALLDQYFGRPTYSLGQKTLDNALVSGTPGVAAKSQAIGNRANQLSSDANQTGKSLENLATANKQATADTAANATGYATGALNNFGTNLNQRYSDFNAGNDTYNQMLRGEVSNLSPNSASVGGPDPYALLGLSGNQDLYGLKDFSPYLKDAVQPTLSQFASPEDAARYKALGQIASDDFQLPIDPTQAGTGGTGRVSPDQAAVQGAVSNRANAYTQANTADKQYGVAKNISAQEFVDDLQNRKFRDPSFENQEYQELDRINQMRAVYGQQPIPNSIVKLADGSGGGLVNPPVGRSV